jgi:hypothetical protein
MINFEWRDSIEESKKALLVFIDEVHRYFPRAIYLGRKNRKHTFIRSLVRLPDDNSTRVPLIPVIIEFLENRYSISFKDKMNIEDAVDANDPLFELVNRISELQSMLLLFSIDKRVAPTLLTMEDVLAIEDVLCDIRDIISGEISYADREDPEVKFLDSDLVDQIEP